MDKNEVNQLKESKMMYWNYRLVLMDVSSPDEPWIDIKEVFYDSEDDNTPTGYGDACIGGEDVKSAQQTHEWVGLAFNKPVLNESDFTEMEVETDD